MSRITRALVGLMLGLGPSFAWGQTPARLKSYRYEAVQIMGGTAQTAYRVDFDLETGRNGSIDAAIRKVETADHGGVWSSPEISFVCRAAMHGGPDAIARVRVWPILTGAEPLGPRFLDLCAPGAVFFPLTDIVNVVLIPVSPQFQVHTLHKTGDTARFPAFMARFDREGRQLEESVPGGQVTLTSRGDHDAVVDWRPDTAKLSLRQPGPQGLMDLHGAESWAFRVSFDPRDGSLHAARTIYDEIAMSAAIPGLPPERAVQVKITRQVTIEPRPSSRYEPPAPSRNTP